MSHSMIEYGQLQAVEIVQADGATAIISLFGAQVLEWKSADGRQRLFCSKQAALDGSKAIRGGIPVIFPQFGTFGPGQRHGFARLVMWHLDGCGSDENGVYAAFSLTQHGMPAEMQAQYPCHLSYRVHLSANALDLQLSVENLGQENIMFTSALHSYLALDDITQTEIHGLQGLFITDYAKNPPEPSWQEDATLGISGKVERSYHAIKAGIGLQTGGQTLELQQSGFTDAMIWNPGAADAKALSDLADEEFTQFVCIEPALLMPCVLEAGQTWVGAHRMTVQA